MVTTQDGILTSNNVGAYNATGGTGERVLVDYKDALQDYKVTDLPALQLFTETMTTDTGGDIDLTFAMPSMNLERIQKEKSLKGGCFNFVLCYVMLCRLILCAKYVSVLIF
mgnify:CR=1 FL=1